MKKLHWVTHGKNGDKSFTSKFNDNVSFEIICTSTCGSFSDSWKVVHAENKRTTLGTFKIKHTDEKERFMSYKEYYSQVLVRANRLIKNFYRIKE